MRNGIQGELLAITPHDDLERLHLQDALAWVESGAPLFRVEKPAVPFKHLVCYFALVDGAHILLVDHKNAQLWLPTGGHVEPDEHPRATVVRELKEELSLAVTSSQIGPPLMITVAETVGLSAGHIDVSLWYFVIFDRNVRIVFDPIEFYDAKWFPFAEVPFQRTDPHLHRFLDKLRPALPKQQAHIKHSLEQALNDL